MARDIGDIEQHINQSDICHKTKSLHTSHAGLLSPVPIPRAISDDVSMDFIINLPLPFGYAVMLVVADHLSKYALLYTVEIGLHNKTGCRGIFQHCGQTTWSTLNP